MCIYIYMFIGKLNLNGNDILGQPTGSIAHHPIFTESLYEFQIDHPVIKHGNRKSISIYIYIL